MNARALPPPGYDAALGGLAAAARPDRARVRVGGRDPAAMLLGVITNRVPDPPVAAESGEGVTRGAARYAAVLTPKGKMVADLRVIRGTAPGEDALLLDVPAGATPGLLAHLGRYLPPRLARSTDVSAETAQLTVAGPDAAAWLARDALGLRVDGAELEALAEDGWIRLDGPGVGTLVLRSGELAAPAFDVIADPGTVEALLRMARSAGAAELSEAACEVLRIEAGRPAWGRELDEEVLPPEAGIDARAIDHTKGCYTGQEVIVRIRDRGHVNRRLRGLLLGDAAVPVQGAQIQAPGRDRPVGAVTSATWSPRAGAALALGYVRREVEPGATVRVGGAEGAEARVVELGEGWWEAS